jgi:hypothetical protein
VSIPGGEAGAFGVVATPGSTGGDGVVTGVLVIGVEGVGVEGVVEVTVVDRGVVVVLAPTEFTAVMRIW